MKRRVIASVIAAALLTALVTSPATAASTGSGSAGVTVRVAVNARVAYTVVDHDHIELRSNAPWRLTLESADRVDNVSGAATGGAPVRLEIPEGTTGYFVTLER